jgi:hypothetical protein
VNIELGGVDHAVGQVTDGLQPLALGGDARFHGGAAPAQRMRATGLTEAAQQGFVGGFEE